jgi:hypothetical protein
MGNKGHLNIVEIVIMVKAIYSDMFYSLSSNCPFHDSIMIAYNLSQISKEFLLPFVHICDPVYEKGPQRGIYLPRYRP